MLVLHFINLVLYRQGVLYSIRPNETLPGDSIYMPDLELSRPIKVLINRVQLFFLERYWYYKYVFKNEVIKWNGTENLI